MLSNLRISGNTASYNSFIEFAFTNATISYIPFEEWTSLTPLMFLKFSTTEDEGAIVFIQIKA